MFLRIMLLLGLLQYQTSLKNLKQILQLLQRWLLTLNQHMTHPLLLQ